MTGLMGWRFSYGQYWAFAGLEHRLNGLTLMHGLVRLDEAARAFARLGWRQAHRALTGHRANLQRG
ncbi:hypothetical protein PU99_16095 [Pseudomonas putida]|nr:hypothetical protein PU99_16095 [Pseudomonas putida]OMQ32728.1 hypothetical protein BKX96_21535 [Pseudomonas putida]